MRIRTVSALLSSLVAFALPASPPQSRDDGVTISIKSDVYEVSGDSVRTLLEEMRQKSPIVDEGKIYFGHTRSDMRWYYEFRRQGGGFAITTASVALDITFTLPQRVAPGDSRNRIAPEWDRYLAALKLHEDGHGRFAIDEAHRLHRKLTAPRVFKNADALRKFVEHEGAAALAASRDVNARYDADTNHGATQGTVLRWDPDSERQQAHARNHRDPLAQNTAVIVQ